MLELSDNSFIIITRSDNYQTNKQQMDIELLLNKIQIYSMVLESALLKSTFRQLFAFYKTMCRKLSYFLTLYEKQVVLHAKYKKTLQQCLLMISVIMKSTEQGNNGSKFPIVQYIIRKYERKQKRKIQPSSSSCIRRSELNEKQLFYKQIQSMRILPCEKNYLKNQFFNYDMIDILNNQIRIPNNECVCCSEIFIRNLQIVNHNPQFLILIGLSQSESHIVNLQRYFCAVCNAGGGTIIVGAQKRESKLQATGIIFKNVLDAQQKQNEILRIMSYIKPEFEHNVKTIFVHNNFMRRNEDAGQQLNRFCFRISIKPKVKNLNKKFYLQIINKGYHTLYETYQLDKDLKQYRVEVQFDDDYNQAISLRHFYHFAMQRYLSPTKSHRSIHQGISCIQPYKQNSKIYNEFIIQNKKKPEKMEKEKGQQLQYNDEPKFKYNKTSILAVGSKKKDRYIKDLILFMKTKKMLFQIQKPFINSFKDGSRSIWMLSHYDKHDIIKNCIKDCDNTGSITMIPVYKTLQIDRTRLSAQQQQLIQRKFKQRYPEGYKTEELVVQDENGMIRYPVLFNFECYPHAIYCYMIFESFQLRPYFVKENTTYKKKPKNQSD